MPEFVYALCAATSVLCALLLLRAYRAQRTTLLFWSGFCFVGLALNNLLLLLDLYIVPATDLFLLRSVYSFRLLGFVLIIAGIVEKNRRVGSRDRRT